MEAVLGHYAWKRRGSGLRIRDMRRAGCPVGGTAEVASGAAGGGVPRGLRWTRPRSRGASAGADALAGRRKESLSSASGEAATIGLDARSEGG